MTNANSAALSMRIAGDKTVADWIKLKQEMTGDGGNRAHWEKAYQDFYLARITTRYLEPIKRIESGDTLMGEGFAIVTLFCTLVEFLESCEKGTNYVRKDTNDLGKHEYNGSKECFKSFLSSRSPFNRLIPLAESFYSDVRCGLLHEARTKGGWTISGDEPPAKQLVDETGGEKRILRKALRAALEEYFEDYKARLFKHKETQDAFIRKFDHLCEP
jgi:hypothetical protein